MELLNWIDGCYAEQLAPPRALIAPKTPPATPQLPFELFSVILQERRKLRQVDNSKKKFDTVLEFFKSGADHWVEYQMSRTIQTEIDFCGKFDKDEKWYFNDSFAQYWIDLPDRSPRALPLVNAWDGYQQY